MATAFSGSRAASSLESDTSFPAFRARVPASTSNCGPGFDTLGLAFDLYNEVTLRRNQEGRMRYAGNHSRFQEREEAMIAEVSRLFFKRTGLEPFGFSFDIRGDVPLARGLGSSVTVRAGIIGALNAASGSPLEKREMVEIVTELEGHPDNAVAAVWGGFCVARSSPATGRFVDAIRFRVSEELRFVVLSPDVEVETRVSRKTLPAQLAFPDVVKSLNSLAFVVSIFATRDYEKLRGAVTDFIHEPYRLSNIPGSSESIAAGVETGAYTGWLSGSGSSILCVCEANDADAVAQAMGKIFHSSGIPFQARTLRCDNEGLTVSKS